MGYITGNIYKDLLRNFSSVFFSQLILLEKKEEYILKNLFFFCIQINIYHQVFIVSRKSDLLKPAKTFLEEYSMKTKTKSVNTFI